MRIPTASTDRYVFFVAVDATDLKTRETGLSSFTVYYRLDDAAAAAMTTPTTVEVDSVNMPGVYGLLIDEAGMTTLATDHDTEELVLHITKAGMAPVTITHEVYRPETTEGKTTLVDASGRVDIGKWIGVVPLALASQYVQTDAKKVNGLAPMSAADVNAEADTALVDINLDHLMKEPVANRDVLAEVADDTVLANLMTKTDGDTSDFDHAIHSLEAIISSVAAAVWDEVLTAAAHNVPTSAGRRLRQVEDVTLIEEDTCQVASDASHIKLAAGSSAENDWYNHCIAVITSGTGARQARCIDDYNGTSKEAVAHPDWLVEPDATSKYTLYTFVEVHVHQIQGVALQEIRDAMKLAPTGNSPAAGSIDKQLDNVEEDTNELQTDDIPTKVAAVDTKVTLVDAVADAIKLKTDNLPGSPAAVGSPMTLEDDALTAAKYDEATAFPVKSADAGDTTLARKGSGAEDLTTVKAASQSSKLAADGLDAISTTEPSALTGINFRERLLAIYRFLFGKTTHTKSAPGQGEFEQYKEDGVAVLLKQATSDDGTTQAKGEATEP